MGSIMGIKILYEDNHILVVEKPPNMLSQGDCTGDADLLSLLKDDLKQRYDKPGNVYLGLIHRLDRPVGGVMVFAKTSKAASRLSEQIRNGTFEKIYLAVVHGVPEKTTGTLEHYLIKDENTNTVSVVPPFCDNAKKAVLDYEVIERMENLSLVRINLRTGRSHQIRVQFATEGCPLFGDQKYGAAKNKHGQQLALWSSRIACIHPTLKQVHVFRSMPLQIYPWDIFEAITCMVF
jgi:23S rRNA pseudouridine1911/1915/1917 synthase